MAVKSEAEEIKQAVEGEEKKKKNKEEKEPELIDLPGVNAQEKTQKALLGSLKIGAEDMLATEIPFEPGVKMTTVFVDEPVWAKSPVT